MENNIQQPEEKKNRKGIVIMLAAVLGISAAGNGILGYLLSKKNTEIVTIKETIIKTEAAKSDVEADLTALKADYSNLQTNDAKLQAEIEEKKAQIDKLIEEAKKHKGDAYVIAQLRKETETLRAIMKSYVKTIDSLHTMNQKLIVEKKGVEKLLDDEKNITLQKTKEIEDRDKVIKKGSVLSCFNVTATGINVKSGGKKLVPTTKAKRAEKIRVSYSLGENKIAKSGDKEIFVRIITPDGKEMAKNYDETYRFTFNGSSGYYAGKTTVSYNNVEIGATTMCEGNSELLPGKYQIEVTADGVVIGNTTLILD